MDKICKNCKSWIKLPDRNTYGDCVRLDWRATHKDFGCTLFRERIPETPTTRYQQILDFVHSKGKSYHEVLARNKDGTLRFVAWVEPGCYPSARCPSFRSDQLDTIDSVRLCIVLNIERDQEKEAFFVPKATD